MVLLRLLHEVTYFFHLAMLRSRCKPDSVKFLQWELPQPDYSLYGLELLYIYSDVFFSVLIISVECDSKNIQNEK